LTENKKEKDHYDSDLSTLEDDEDLSDFDEEGSTSYNMAEEGSGQVNADGEWL